MKRVIIVAIGAFLMIAIGVSAKTSMYDIVYVQFDKTTMIKKKIADARMQIARGNYQAAINTINSIIRLDPENETAASLMQECEDGIARQKAKEYQDYLKASRSGSVPEMESFIAMYPQSEYVDNIRMCIAENTLWQEAKKQNTISAYEFYLSQSSMLTYKTDANDAIQILQSDIAWEKCKDSNDEYELSSFIQQYPLSPYIGNAKYKLNILRGERYFSGMDFKLAYNYLDEADRYQRLTGTSALHLSQMKERRKFESIISNTSIYDVRTYLKSLSSDSPYYSPTSNHLALLLGASLTQYSSELEIDEALFYAVDNVTNEKVRYYIKTINEQKKRTEHIRLVRARKAWWQNRFKIGWNIFHVDYLDDVCSVGTGVKFRFGKWSDIVNLLFGAEYIYNMYIDGNVEDLWEDDVIFTISHQVEIPVGLRFNLFHVGDNYKFYLGCNANFGFTLSENNDFCVNKRTLAIDPQIGIAGNKIDFGIYYKRYIDDKLLFQYTEKYVHRVGCFLTLFF